MKHRKNCGEFAEPDLYYVFYLSNSKLELEAVQWGNRCYLIIGGEVIPVTPGGISEVKQLYYIHDGEYKIGNIKINAGYHNQAEVVYSDDGYVLPNIEQARNMIASRKDSLSTYYTNADSEISVDQQNGAIVANLSKSTNEVSKSDYSRESVDLDGPTPSTLVLVAETTRSADDPSWYDTNVKANFVEKWNEQIYESPGYALGARVPSNLSSGPNRVDIPVPDTAKEGMKLANDWISEETDWMGRFDAIVVLDNAGLTGTNGRAPKGRKNNTAAGTNDRMVGYADNSFSSGLALHELGHMYGGRHTHHRKKGWDKFTIMGNRGNTTCGGNKSEFWRTRNEKFSDCAKDTIKEYMQYCYDEKDYF